MRHLVDALIIILLLMIGSSIKTYSENIDYTKLAERITSFETDVSVNNVLDTNYVPNKVYVKQVDENRAGRMAHNVSKVIEEFLETTFDFTNEMFYQVLK